MHRQLVEKTLTICKIMGNQYVTMVKHASFQKLALHDMKDADHRVSGMTG
jgi:hypothetical protein